MISLLYTIGKNKTINIPNTELERYKTKLGLSEDEAVHLWLADNDYEVDNEQEEMEKKAKGVRIQCDATPKTYERKSDKPRNIKISDAKKELFAELLQFLTNFSEENDAKCEVLTSNKLIQVNFKDETFKVDIIQQRKPKK